MAGRCSTGRAPTPPTAPAGTSRSAPSAPPLSANVQVLRARCGGMQALFSSLPSPASARTAAQLSSIALGPVAIAALLPLVAFAAKNLVSGSLPGLRFTPGLLGYLVVYF